MGMLSTAKQLLCVASSAFSTSVGLPLPLPGPSSSDKVLSTLLPQALLIQTLGVLFHFWHSPKELAISLRKQTYILKLCLCSIALPL